MGEIGKTCWKILRIGAWAPLLVFATHVFIGRVLNAYDVWPSIDMPMHFSGGMAIAFFVSRCFRSLPREAVRRSRVVVLELLLVVSLTATAAVFWEFAEFSFDQLFSTNVQVSLANTIRDMALGVSAAAVFVLIRARKLRAGPSELKELTFDWLRGQPA